MEQSSSFETHVKEEQSKNLPLGVKEEPEDCITEDVFDMKPETSHDISSVKDEPEETVTFIEEGLYVSDGLSEDFPKKESEEGKPLWECFEVKWGTAGNCSSDTKEDDPKEGTSFDERGVTDGHKCEEVNCEEEKMDLYEDNAAASNSNDATCPFGDLNASEYPNGQLGENPFFSQGMYDGVESASEENADDLLKLMDSKLYKCSLCGFETKYSRNLKRHVLIHTDTKLYVCSGCSYQTNYKSNLKKHSLNCACLREYGGGTDDKGDPKEKNRGGAKLHKCSQCEYQTNYKSDLKKHALNHSEVKMFKCDLCHYETNFKSALKVHTLNHNATKLYKCDQCDYETNYRSKLREHALNHNDTKMYKCDLCPYETNYKSDLKKHSLNHNEIKLFKCHLCQYETNFKSALKVHLLSHNDTKLFNCSLCQYGTNYKSAFKEHCLNHSDTKLYKCSLCVYETNYKGDLRKHILRHGRTD